MRLSRLRELSRRFSIETSYTDAAGRRRTAGRDVLVALIEKRAGRSIGELDAVAGPTPAVEPVNVLWGTERSVRLNLTDASRVEWDLELEDGSWRSGRSSVFGGSISLDVPLPPGYHMLTLNAEHTTLLIAAPKKAASPRARTWGLFVPLYAGHTRRSWGAGDVGDLLAWSGWVDALGGGVVATLPMLASFEDEPSPYSPISRLYWNEMYLDVTRLPELADGDIDDGAVAHLQQTRDIDYAALRREKRRVLEACAARFIPDDEFEQFVRKARDYAAWRASFEQRDSASYHLYVQYRMAQQMRAAANAARRLGVGLYLDFPLGVNGSGYDVQRYPGLFARGVSVGSPPDPFFTKGQNWGFPPFDPDAIRRDRYAYFRAAIAHHMAHAGILRLDHVMGLHRLYWIPEGADAADGTYVRYRAEELYAILTLESRRHGCVVVGEDLGTVPPEVPRTMHRHGIRRMYVVQYEAKGEQPPVPPPPAASVASLNTHDMPPFRSFWSAADVDDRVEQNLLDVEGADAERSSRDLMKKEISAFLVEKGHLTGWPGEDTAKVLEGLLAFLASSAAEIVLVNPEDLWGEVTPQNRPGVPEQSWRQKFRLRLEDAQADGTIRRLLERVQARRVHDLSRESETTTHENLREVKEI